MPPGGVGCEGWGSDSGGRRVGCRGVEAQFLEQGGPFEQRRESDGVEQQLLGRQPPRPLRRDGSFLEGRADLGEHLLDLGADVLWLVDDDLRSRQVVDD
jgi:hypothetical protein